MARRTSAEKRAARLVELEKEKEKLKAEQDEYDKKVMEASKAAGFARSHTVEQLYEMCDIEPITKLRQNADGTKTRVNTDKNENQRTAQLVGAIKTLISERDELRQRADPVSSPHVDKVNPRVREGVSA